MMGSCGYTRVMIVITPIMALIGTYAFDMLMNQTKRFKKVALTLLLALIGISAHHAYSFVKNRMPYDISEEQKEFEKVAEWLKSYDYKDKKVYFLYPYLNILTSIDPYDKEHFEFLWSFDFDYSGPGSLLIWDGHFGPNECQIPLEKLMNNPDFVLIKSFKPQKPFTTLNNYPFEIHVFERVKITRK